jgi:hypothetical protein
MMLVISIMWEELFFTRDCEKVPGWMEPLAIYKMQSAI